MAESRKTTYVVLLQDSNDTFRQLGKANAVSSNAAIKYVAGQQENPNGSYVAVPERSFSLVPVRVKTMQPQLVLGEEVRAPEPVLTGVVSAAATAAKREIDLEDEI